MLSFGKKDHSMREKQDIQIGIAKKLIAAFSVVSLLSLLVGFTGWIGLAKMNKASDEVLQVNLPAISSALSLSEQTANLVASAPLLISSQSDEERQARNQKIVGTLSQSQTIVDKLSPLLNSPEKDKYLNDLLEKFPSIFQRINEIVLEKQSINLRREELKAEVISLRDGIKTLLEPAISDIDMRILENIDNWSEKMSDGVDQAKTGQDPDLDTSDLEEDTFQAFSFQSAVSEFKSSAFLLSGLLLQGAQRESIQGVKDVETQFYNSLSVMSAPLSDLENQLKDKKFRDAFDRFVLLGSKGDVNQNLFKLRLQELTLDEENQELLRRAQGNSKQMSEYVSGIVHGLELENQRTKQENQEVTNVAYITLSAVALLSLVVSGLIGWLYVKRNLVHRLLTLVGSMKNIAEGDLETRINRNGSDEISQMAMQLTVLRNGLRETEKLKQKQEEMREQAEKEKRENALLFANEFDQSVGQSLSILSENVSGIREQISHMNQVALQTTKETEEVNQMSHSVSEDVSIVATSADQLSASINEISQQVTYGADVSSQAVYRAEKLNENIENLHNASKRIEGVISLINTIAEQINLLALNATIEASRAGEAGKGFAVVASEVKALATQTASAIEDIQDLIGGIQTEINEAVQSNGQICSIVDEMSSVSSSISAAVEEQSAATTEISRTVNNTAQSVNAITQSVLQVTNSIKASSSISSKVLDGVMLINEQNDQLTKEVDEFLDSVRKA